MGKLLALGLLLTAVPVGAFYRLLSLLSGHVLSPLRIPPLPEHTCATGWVIRPPPSLGEGLVTEITPNIADGTHPPVVRETPPGSLDGAMTHTELFGQRLVGHAVRSSEDGPHLIVGNALSLHEGIICACDSPAIAPNNARSGV